MRIVLLAGLLIPLSLAPLELSANSLINNEPVRVFIGEQKLFGYQHMMLDKCLRENDIRNVPTSKMNGKCGAEYSELLSPLMSYSECVDDLLAERQIPRLMYPQGDDSGLRANWQRVWIGEVLAVDLGMADKIKVECIEKLKAK